MSHLIGRDVENDPSPAFNGLRLSGGQSFRGARAQAEGRVQIGAHEVVLELGGFIQRVQQSLARGGAYFNVHSFGPRSVPPGLPQGALSDIQDYRTFPPV